MNDLILTAAAKEAASSIRSGVTAVFGPAGREMGEYLADKIKYHRYKSLMKIFEKVQAEFGTKPKIPPYKFFVPFCEQASLEEDDDEVIIDIWSRLLKDAINQFSSRHMIFMRLVKEMTSREAQLLHDICYDFRGSTDDPGVWGVGDAPGYITEAGIYKFLVDWGDSSERPHAPFRKKLIEKFEVPGVFVRHVTFARGVRGVWPYREADDDPDADQVSPIETKYPRISFDILRGLNILNEITTNEIWHRDQVVIVTYSELSPLGVEFFSLCNQGLRVVPKRGDSWSADAGWR